MFIVKNLKCQKGYNLLFKNLSFTIKDGDILRIIGNNGSGKTSLLKILAGISIINDSAQISLDNNKVFSDDYKQQILYLGHQSLINKQLSVIENLSFLHTLNHSSKVNYKDALIKIGLKNYIDEYCYSLSAGQQRRVILAMLFLSTKKIWLLDEPFTAIDSSGVKLIEKLITKHCQIGGICIFTTHQAVNLNFKKISL